MPASSSVPFLLLNVRVVAVLLWSLNSPLVSYSRLFFFGPLDLAPKREQMDPFLFLFHCNPFLSPKAR